MWYAILPTTAVITAALGFSMVYAYFSNKVVLGQPFRRIITERESAFMYLRDTRLSDRKWAYDYKGLDNIPDSEVPKKN